MEDSKNTTVAPAMTSDCKENFFIQEVRCTCHSLLRLTAEGRSVVLEVPYYQKEREEALSALKAPENSDITATLITAEGIPDFILDSCFKKPLTMKDVAIFHEMILEFHDLANFDMNRWERQVRMLQVNNFSDLNIVFDSSQLLHDFPDLHSKEQVITHLCSMTGSHKMAPYMERFTFLKTAAGMLMYTARDQEMMDFMNRKKFF
ncbi:MAG: hypothetical protein R3Y63_08100 [Eubacteriales bacterium]